MNINIGRVLLGGLVTGIILNAGEVVLHDILLGAQTKAFFAEHNFRDPGPSFIVAAVGELWRWESSSCSDMRRSGRGSAPVPKPQSSPLCSRGSGSTCIRESYMD